MATTTLTREEVLAIAEQAAIKYWQGGPQLELDKQMERHKELSDKMTKFGDNIVKVINNDLTNNAAKIKVLENGLVALTKQLEELKKNAIGQADLKNLDNKIKALESRVKK